MNTLNAFTLDTSGAVEMPVTTNIPSMSGMHILVRWSDLSPFEQGYVEAVFASLCAPPAMETLRFSSDAKRRALGLIDPNPRPMEIEEVTEARAHYREFTRPIREPRFSDLAPETLAAIRKDCAEFEPRLNIPADKEAGGYFWEWRQENWLTADVWERRSFRKLLPPLTPSLGDDGKVYLRGPG